MKMKHLFYFTGSKRNLLLLIVLLVGTMSMYADVDYGFWVGSVKVKKSNCNNITGGNIGSGTVKYDPDTNVLTLTNVKIEGTGSGGDCIHNKSCEGLKVEFYGTNTLSAKDTCAIWTQTTTYFSVKSGTTSISNNKDGRYAVYLENSYSVFIYVENGSELNITANKDYAIGGKGTANLHLHGGGNNTIKGAKGCLVNLSSVLFIYYSNCCVTLKATNNSSYPIVKNVNRMVYNEQTDYINYSTAVSGNPIIVSPLKAEFSASQKSICSSSGSPVYSSDIKITNDYAQLVNSRYFPDANFRSYIENRFSSIALSQSQINNCTSMDVNGRSISSLEGISYFTELQTLDCYNNNLTTLSGVSLGKLTSLDCRNNKLTRLGYSCSRLQKLYCGSNQLTSITSSDMGNMKQLYCSDNKLTSIYFPGTGLTDLYCSNNNLTTLSNINMERSTLQYFYCENNAFTSLDIENFSKLSDFRCSNNPSLKTLICSYNSSLTSLNVTNCASLNTMTCSSNTYMTWLGLSSVPALETLTCTYNGRMTSISLNCSKLKTLKVYNNALTTLNLSDCSYLDVLDCSNNQLTSMELPYMVSDVNCSSNKFTSLFWGSAGLISFNCSSNPYLTSLYLPSNRYLNNLNVADCNALKIIDISGCALSTINLSNRTALEELKCDNQTDHCLTSLNVTGCSGLKKLSCNWNKLTSLNLTSCNALTEIVCNNNRLTSITLPSSCPSLQSITCHANSIGATAMNSLVAALPNRMNSSVAGSLKVLYTGTSYAEGNVCMTTHINNAKAKNWNTYQSPDGNNWILNTGIPTDIRTAEADIDDNAPRYNMNGQRVGNDYKGIVIVKGQKIVK